MLHNFVLAVGRCHGDGYDVAYRPHAQRPAHQEPCWQLEREGWGRCGEGLGRVVIGEAPM
jgi:hypothetical protein